MNCYEDLGTRVLNFALDILRLLMFGLAVGIGFWVACELVDFAMFIMSGPGE